MNCTGPTSRLIATLFLAASACAGPVVTRAGRDGMPLPPSSGVALAPVPAPASTLAERARSAVAAELERRGGTSIAEGGTRLEVTMGVRPEAVAVADARGHAVSPGHKRRFLRTCHRQTQRMTVTAIDANFRITRAWAEERHCQGNPEDSIAPLAAQAVAMLFGKGRPRTLHPGRD